MNDKVIIFVSPHRNLYGAEKSLLSMMRGVREYGYKPVLVIGGDGNIEKELKKQKIEYIKHSFCGWINMQGKKQYMVGLKCLIKNFVYSRKLARCLKSKYQNIVMVHTNSIITDFGVHLSRVLGVPHVYHIREFGELDFHMVFNLGKIISSYIIKKSAAIICISDAVKKYYQKFLCSNQLIRVYNGIGVDVIDKNNYDRAENKVAILLIGRLSQEKGQEDVIEAAEYLVKKKITSFYVSFYGDGVDEDKLKKMVRDKKLHKYIRFEGYQTVIPYGAFDFAIMASISEAFGRVTVEYMLNNLPVVGAKCGATTEIINENKTGVLYQSGNVVDLAEKMERLIIDAQLRTELGKNAQKVAMEKFTEDKYWKNIINVYETIIN